MCVNYAISWVLAGVIITEAHRKITITIINQQILPNISKIVILDRLMNRKQHEMCIFQYQTVIVIFTGPT